MRLYSCANTKFFFSVYRRRDVTDKTCRISHDFPRLSRSVRERNTPALLFQIVNSDNSANHTIAYGRKPKCKISATNMILTCQALESRARYDMSLLLLSSVVEEFAGYPGTPRRSARYQYPACHSGTKMTGRRHLPSAASSRRKLYWNKQRSTL